MDKVKPFFSVVVPVYGCRCCISELYDRLCLNLEPLNQSFEIILVDDNDPQNSWEVIQKLGLEDNRVRALRLSRNFGQHKAITAGLEHSRGQWVVVMDCDLQDLPEEIPNLYNKACEGFDMVLAKRVIRQDSFFKKFFSKMFYKLLGYLTGTRQDSTIANFGIYSRQVIDAVCAMKDAIRFFPAMVQWVGFSVTTLPVKHGARDSGRSSYCFGRLFRMGSEVILAFSDKPLRLTIKAGVFISILSIIYALFILYRYATGDIEILGYTSLFVSIWFLAGIIIILIGMVGLYLGRVFEKVKDRPLYIVRNQINVE